MNFLEGFGLLHVVLYCCIGIAFVVYAMFKGLAKETKKHGLEVLERMYKAN